MIDFMEIFKNPCTNCYRKCAECMQTSLLPVLFYSSFTTQEEKDATFTRSKCLWIPCFISLCKCFLCYTTSTMKHFPSVIWEFKQVTNSLIKLTVTGFQSHAYYVFLDSNTSSEWGASSLTFLGPCIRLSINLNFHHTLKASLKTFVEYSSKGYTFILYLLAIWGFILWVQNLFYIPFHRKSWKNLLRSLLIYQCTQWKHQVNVMKTPCFLTLNRSHCLYSV